MQTRWFVAKETIALGRGGLKYMHELTGVSRPTILKGIEEIKSKKRLNSIERIRSMGGGRKSIDPNSWSFLPPTSALTEQF